MNSNPKIAFVGVGRMGANMARRLKDCGYAVTAIYDAHAPSAAALAAELQTTVGSPGTELEFAL